MSVYYHPGRRVVELCQARARASLTGPMQAAPPDDPFAAVCMIGQLRARGENATLHWQQQMTFMRSLMLGEAWAGLHVVLVSDSDDLEQTHRHMQRTWGLPEANLHAIRAAGSAHQSAVDHCPALASGTLPVICSKAVLQGCSLMAPDPPPAVPRRRKYVPIPQYAPDNETRDACKMCTRAGVRENVDKHATGLTLATLMRGTGPLGDGGDADAWQVGSYDGLMYTRHLPRAIRSFYAQWDKAKVCMAHIRSLENSWGRRFRFVVKTRTDWPFVRGPALSSLQNGALLYSRYRCSWSAEGGDGLIPVNGYTSSNRHNVHTSNAECPRGLFLFDDQFIVAPRGDRWRQATAADALFSAADLPCPLDRRVQKAIAQQCMSRYWAECLLTVALRATPQQGRAGPIIVTWGDLEPLGGEPTRWEGRLCRTCDKLTGMPLAVPNEAPPRFNWSLGQPPPVPEGCKLCHADWSLHCCSDPRCTERRLCASSKKVSACGCPGNMSHGGGARDKGNRVYSD